MQPIKNTTDLKRMEQLGRLVAELSAETDNRELPGAILTAALDLTGADGGALYLQMTPALLSCEVVRIISLNLSLAGDELVDVLPVVLIPEGRVSEEPLLRTFLENRAVLIEAKDGTAEDLLDQQQFDQTFAYRTRRLLSVPLGGVRGEVLGVIQLMNPRSGTFTEEDCLLIAQLATYAASILAMNQQLDEQKALFESTIQMLAGAVDEKFYLGADHCRRVPILTMMLADAVNRSAEPPFAGQVFTQQDLYELEVAAWLHDCGKLVTPINLVDKSRKLEMVFDRIDLIQTRFEIIRRDEEIARLRQGLAGEELPVVADGQNRSQQMLEDLHFLTGCNHGKKSMTCADQQRIEQIAGRYRWIGRQMEEASVLTADEIANLSILSGTLNDRERVKINNHSLATIGMLDLLPFPEDLKRVPDIISGYHENRDEQPLLQARILAIADRFVSVTAENRPYCKTNSLDEAMEILHGMRDGGQLDADLLELFVRERLHQQYAAEFLSEEQGGFSEPQ